MKVVPLIPVVVACLSATSQMQAQQPAQAPAGNGAGHGIQFMPAEVKPPVGKAITDAELNARRAKENFSGFAPEDVQQKGWDLVDYSDFIVFDGNVTIVPKGSIIHVPERFKAHVVSKPVGRLVPWAEFCARYRGLVSTKTVSLDEVAGKTPIEAKSMDAVRSSDLISVAVHNGNPISVAAAAIPPVNPEATRK